MKGIYAYYDNEKEAIIYIGKDSHIDRYNNRHYQHSRKCNYNHQVINRIIQNNPSRYSYHVLVKGDSDLIDDDLLNTLEKEHIKTYDPKFNFTDGGDGRTGHTPWNKGMKFPKELHPMYNCKLSEETKQKISENHADVSGTNNPRYRLDVPTGEELYLENKRGRSYIRLSKKYNCGWSTIQRRIAKYKQELMS